MKIHRFILPQIQIEEGQTLNIEDPRVVHQVTHVLRFRKGDTMVISNNEGTEATVRIDDIQRQYITIFIKSTDEIQEVGNDTVLYCSIIKKDNFELIVQKATEVGVKEIVPMKSERVVKLGLRYDRLQIIALEAAEQCGRGTVPKIHEAMSFTEAARYAQEYNQQNILFDGSGEELDRRTFSEGRSGIFIGPEGGFTEGEVNEAKQAGFEIALLGPLTLRAETAAIISSYIITHT